MFSDFKLYLDHPPTDISDKFNERPLRHLVVVKPETEQDKRRFLQNIWRSTAYLKAQGDKSIARYLKQDTRSIYWNFYDRRAYLQESRKVSYMFCLAFFCDVGRLISFCITGENSITDRPFGIGAGPQLWSEWSVCSLQSRNIGRKPFLVYSHSGWRK